MILPGQMMKTLALNKILSQPKQFYFIALNIVINKELSQKEAIEYFQEYYNDECGGTGNWRLRPQDDSSITTDYVDFGKGGEPRAGAYSTSDGKTTIDLVLYFNLDPAYSGEVLPMDEELKAISEELNTFARINNCEWEQLNINPKFIRVVFNADNTSVLQDVLILDDYVTPEALIANLEAGDFFTTLDYNPDEENIIFNISNHKIAKIVAQQVYVDDKKEFSFTSLIK